MRPTAGNAALRPAQNSSRSSSTAGARSVTAPQDFRDRRHALDQVAALRLRAVELDDQQGLGVERIAGVDEGLGRVDRRAVHHLHPARDDAGADDLRPRIRPPPPMWGSRSARPAPSAAF